MPSLDLWPLLETLTIRPKSGEMKLLQRDDPFAWAQREFVAEVERQYNAGKPVRIVVLKGRQLGLSTVTEAILFLWALLHPGSRGLVLSKENDDSEHLYGMTKLYYEKGPFYGLYPTRYYTQENLEFEGIGSVISTSTAKKADVGRGKTVQALHCSEVAFWERSEDMIPSLMNSISGDHGTICILESTANGVGNYFHETWIDAQNRANDFVPMFFPWFLHFEYELPQSGLTIGELDDDEMGLLERFPEMNLAKLAWRRKKIAELPGGVTDFHAEYPCTPDEAFLSTGKNAMPLADVEECYFPNVPRTKGYLYNNTGIIDFEKSQGGNLTVYQWPDTYKARRYAVALDPTRTVTGDPACIQVLDRATLEQVAVWHAHTDPKSLAQIALAIGRFYHTALMNTEIQGGGKTVLEIWRADNYPNIWVDRRSDNMGKFKKAFGFSTTFTSKHILIGTLISAFVRRQLVLHHTTTFHQLMQYTNLGTGQFGPARRSGEDDCVMSFAIGVYTVMSDAATPGYLQSQAESHFANHGPSEPGVLRPRGPRQGILPSNYPIRRRDYRAPENPFLGDPDYRG